MKSKTSLFNKSLIKSDFKRFWWISLLYALALFFVLPFSHLVAGPPGTDRYSREMFRRSLDFASGPNQFQILLICVLPVIIAVLLFKYLNTAKSAGMMHSLPLTRKAHYINHSLVGLILLLAPVLLNGIILAVFQRVTFLSSCYDLIDILRWMGLTVLFNIVFYAMSIFVGMFTGSSIAQIVFTYIFYILPAGVNVFWSFNLRQWLWGYAETNTQRSFINELPFIALLDHRLGPEYFSGVNILLYLLFTAVFMVLGYYVYKIRKLESAGEIVAFPVVRPVFKYGVTICCTLVGGVYFAEVSRDSLAIIVFGYVFSSFLGYWVAEMLIKKSFRVWGAYKGYLAYTLLLLILLIGVKTDFIVYQSRIPELDQVEKIYFGSNYHKWATEEQNEVLANEVSVEGRQITEYTADIEGGCFFTNQENMAHLIELHKKLAAKPYSKEGRYRYIVYTLKNGKYLIRQYPIDENRFSKYIGPIYESMEYKEARFPILTQEIDQIKSIEIKDERTPKRPLILADIAEIEEFRRILQQELTEASFQELTITRNVPTGIRIIDDQDHVQYYQLPKEYQTVFDWLKEKGYYQDIILFPEEVEYAELISREEYDGVETREPANPEKVKITDPQLIKELLEACENYEYQRAVEAVRVIFYVKEGGRRIYEWQGDIQKDAHVSEELADDLKRLN